MNPIKLSREIIESQIEKHFRENFDPQNPQLDMIAEFIYSHGHYELTFEVPYSTCNIRIYEDEEMSCKCGVLDVELVLTRFSQDPKAKSLGYKLTEIEEEKAEELEQSEQDAKDIEETNDTLNEKNR